ncbi:MAG TPA: hypothetical protein VMD48_03940, partial [Solirubrobacteraceae bacterium]|nr:hypothetical protein [Solirubrobacteraceae bacterium]
SAKKLYSGLEKQFAMCRHRFEHASARELRNLLPGDLPESLLTRLDDLVVARNDLAHEYLRRTLGESMPDLPHATRFVRSLGERFVEAGDQLRALAEQARAARPPNLSDEQYESLQLLGRAAAAGMALDAALASLANSKST